MIKQQTSFKCENTSYRLQEKIHEHKNKYSHTSMRIHKQNNIILPIGVRDFVFILISSALSKVIFIYSSKPYIKTIKHTHYRSIIKAPNSN